MKPIPVYILNLPQRIDRRESIIFEFQGKQIFDVSINSPIKHPIGSNSLWISLKRIVAHCSECDFPYFIFCEDDHVFTKWYSPDALISAIYQAQSLNADILLGGVSWHDMPIQCGPNLFHIQSFNGLQFAIVFQKFYNHILDLQTDINVVADIALSHESEDIFVMWPFISIQKEFGYSDVTEGNNTPNYVSKLFRHAEKELDILNKVKVYYDNLK